MSAWQSAALGELVRFRNGRSIAPGGIGEFPVYGSNGIIGGSDASLYAEGIILGRVGAYCGSVAISSSPFWASDNTIVVEPIADRLDLTFGYYLLRHANLNRHAGGAAQPLLTQSRLRPLSFSIPGLDEQRRIGSLLGAYDGLIDIHRRRIALLERMARSLFEEWFLRFRFRGHENVVITETADGPLPEGWMVAPLGDWLRALESGSRPKGGIKVGEGDVPSIGAENINGLGRFDFDKERLIPSAFFREMRRGIVESGDVLLYKDGAHIGRKSMFRDGYPYAECAINEHVFILRPKPPVSPVYLYFWLDQERLTGKIKALNSNAAQPGINQGGVGSLPLLLPDEEFLRMFTDAVEPMMALLFASAKSIRRLTLSRDLLVPRLVSGQLTLPQAEPVVDTDTASELLAVE